MSNSQQTLVDRALPVEVYDAYSAISQLARSINVPVQAPEIVFIGKKGAGKSVLIEAFLGHRFFDVAPSARPVVIKMVNDVAAETPVVTVLADTASGAAEEADVPAARVPEALKERNVRTDVPLRVVYRHRHTWDLTVVDTPGLLSRGDDAEEMRAVEQLVLGIASRASLVVAVEEANEWDRASEALDIARRVDPKLERSLFVFNKFHPFLKNFSGARELRQYLAACPMAAAGGRVFFTTSPGDSGRPDNAALYRRRLSALLKADLEALEALQYDRKLERNVGAAAVQRSILDITWRRYQGLISEILRRLRELNRQAVDGRMQTAAQLESLSPCDLRQRASAHASALLRAASDLLLGSLEGRPAQHGQTTPEERAAATELGAWVDAKHERVELAQEAVPCWDCRLYGAQQFERLLAEFRAVVATSASSAEVGADDIATALGIGKVDVAPNIAWAASDIAQAKSRAALAPLVTQLLERAAYVTKRLADIAESVVARSAAKQAATTPALPPFFASHVKDLFCAHVDELAAACLAKCMDEFYCTRLVYWDMGQAQSEILDRYRAGATADEAVRALAENLFEGIRKRVVDNVLLKCYEGMLVPLQSDVAVHVHGKIALLGDAELEEMFEMDATKAALKAKQEYWDGIHAKYQEQEAAFLKAAVAFTHHGI